MQNKAIRTLFPVFVKRMETGSSCLSIRTRGKGQKLMQRKFHPNMRNLRMTGTGCPEMPWVFLPRNTQKLTGNNPKKMCSKEGTRWPSVVSFNFNHFVTLSFWLAEEKWSYKKAFRSWLEFGRTKAEASAELFQ